MYEEPLLTMAVIVVLLLSIAATSAIFVEKFNFPYTVGLVIAGIARGFAAFQVEILQPIQQPEMSREIILYVILPTLLFDTAPPQHLVPGGANRPPPRRKQISESELDSVCVLGAGMEADRLALRLHGQASGRPRPFRRVAEALPGST